MAAVVNAAIWLVVSLRIWSLVKPATCVAFSADAGRGDAANVGGGDGGDFVARQRTDLRGGEGADLGRRQRADLVGVQLGDVGRGQRSQRCGHQVGDLQRRQGL